MNVNEHDRSSWFQGRGEAAHWRAACSEFPNDNPQLHEGAVWICQAVRARPRAVLRAEPAAEPLAAAAETAGVPQLDLVFPDAPEAPVEEAEPVSVSVVLQAEEPDAVVEPSEAAEANTPTSVNSQAADDLLWRSQLETRDPFLSELAELISGNMDSPLGIFAPTLTEAQSAQPALASGVQHAVPEALEPISLEGFVLGEILPLSNVPKRVQSLNALELPANIESLSGTEQAWDDVLLPLSAFLLERGATHAAIILPRLLAGDAVSVLRLPRAAQQCLVAEDFASEHDGAVLIRPEFRARARRLHRAHRAGTLEAGTLRRFVASVTRALLATPMDAAELTRQLESAGVKLGERAA